MRPKIVNRNLLPTLIAFALGVATTQAQTTIGIGAEHDASDVDNAGTRMNIEKSDDTFPTLEAGSYDITDFAYLNNEEVADIQPFLAISTDDAEYVVVWIGPTEESPGDDDIVTTSYDAGSQQFTLEDDAEVYAGFNTAGPNVRFGGGLTDHANPADFEIEVDSEIFGFGHANLGRSYAFHINVLPSSSGIEAIAIVPVVAFPTADKPVVLSSAAVGVSVGSLSGLNEFGNAAGELDYSLVAGEGDTNNSMYTIGGAKGDQLLVAASLAGAADAVHSVRVTAEGDDGAFTAAVTFTVAPDSDSDGLIDAWEVMFGTLAEFSTDGDHDVDGLTDDDEFRRGLNPDEGDADKDGSLDGEEIAAGTDLTKPDTDGDGLNDGDEATAKSNPLVADTDGDSINDGDEVGDANGFSTDPTKADTDGDGFDDDLELAEGSDPTDAASQPVITEVVIGVGADHEGSGVDSAGSRMNIENSDDTFPTLPAGTYDVTDFEYSNSADVADIQPFLVVSTDEDIYSVIWIGPTDEAPGDDDIVTTSYEAGSQQFTLDEPAEVYAGFNADGPVVKFGAGLTDHANPADFEIELDGEIADFGHANLPRSYAFNINVEKSGSGPSFQITEITYAGGETPTVTLTFDSRPGANYGVFASTAMAPDGQPGSWLELTDNLESQGEETTYVDTAGAELGAEVYYQIRTAP